MTQASKLFSRAVAHHEAGRLSAAEGLYNQVLEAEPEHAEAIHLLGVIAGQRGNHQTAAEYIGRAIALDATNAEFHVNLAEAYRALRKPSDAVACCQRGIELAPGDAGAYHNLGNALRDDGKIEEAINAFRRATELNPKWADAHFALATAMQQAGKFKEAFAVYQRAIDLQPDAAEMYHKVGDALRGMGQLPAAIACFRRAVKLAPRRGECHNNLGCALRDHGQGEEAVQCFRRAIDLEPNNPAAHSNLALLLQDIGRFTEALDHCQRALNADPNLPAALNGLGCLWLAQGRLDDAEECFRKALAADPSLAYISSNLLFILQYREGMTCQRLAEAHAEFEKTYAAPLAGKRRPHLNSRDPERRLRLGFVSPDFHQHPVALLLIRVLENLDRDAFDSVCYSHHTSGDKVTKRLRDAATEFRDVQGHSDEQVAEQIREDCIDVLFDLAGHTGKNRLLIFARKPAPLQMTWIGYEGTTGLTAMDYLIADRYVLPEGMEHYYRETVLRMPDGYVCFEPPAAAPDVGGLPALGKGYVTFGSFNNPVKITRDLLVLWSEILRRVPESRLALKYKGLDDPATQRRFFDVFAEAGISAERIELLPSSSYSDYLAAYQQVDIALDTRPFSGSATTCDALWMGVPVITAPGETFASRHTLSHLSNLGLFEVIAVSRDDYIERAIALAADLPRLAELRAGLRERMAASPLCDGSRFARNFMNLIRGAWRQWCEQA